MRISKYKKTHTFILIVFLVVIIGWWSLSDEDGVKSDLAPVVHSVDTSEWKTYHNTKFGFSFMYPQDWHISAEGFEQEDLGESDTLVIDNGYVAGDSERQVSVLVVLGKSDVKNVKLYLQLNAGNNYTVTEDHDGEVFLNKKQEDNIVVHDGGDYFIIQHDIDSPELRKISETFTFEQSN